MRAKRIPFEQQLQLIMECRSSGLTDAQWCLEHNIKPSTFYNWVKRNQQKACAVIPDATGRKARQVPTSRQDVVRIDPKQLPVDEPVCTGSPVFTPAGCLSVPEHVLEIEMAGALLRITNDVSPGLLAQTIRIIRGMPC